MALEGYTEIPPELVEGGAPIDAFYARAVRENHIAFHQKITAALGSPFGAFGGFFPSTGTTEVEIGGAGMPVADAARWRLNAKKITMNNAVTTNRRMPLIWVASQSIILKQKIDATGQGAENGVNGDFGGSGGGDASGSLACRLEVVHEAAADAVRYMQMVAGAGPNGAGQVLGPEWLSWLPFHLHRARGGGPGGGGAGAAGGGVVILCAPTIQFDGAAAEIEAKGQPNTGAGTGGGGGGLILLLAGKFLPDLATVQGKLSAAGGAAVGGGQAGGAGIAKAIEIF